MSELFRVRPIGDLDLLTPLLEQLYEAGAVESPHIPTSLVLVGATTTAHAETCLVNLTPRLRRRAVIVGIDEHLDLGRTIGSFSELLDRMGVLGALPSITPFIRSFIGPLGDGDRLPKLVDATFFKLGPSSYKVWSRLPAVSPGKFLVELVRAIEADGCWFDGPPVRYAQF